MGKDNVVSLLSRAREMQMRPVAEVDAYWHGLRRGRLVPTRGELDPRAMAGALEWVFVLERIAPGLARVRIAGQRLSDLLGVDAKGIPFSTLFEPAVRPAVSDAVEALFDAPAAIRFQLAAPAGLGRAQLDAEMVLLPLRSDLGDVTRALGCLCYSGNPGRRPRRFAIADEDRRSLTGYGERDPYAQPASRAAEAAEDAAAFEPAPRPSAPYLRLVKSDD